MKIVGSLNLPWVVILSMVPVHPNILVLSEQRAQFSKLNGSYLSMQDSFYKSLTPEQSELAFRNEYDFDSPDSIDFDVLVERLHDLKMGYVSSDSKLYA